MSSVNRLIALGGRGVKSPVERFIETKGQMERGRLRNVREQAGYQNMDINRNREDRDAKQDRINMIAPVAKAVLSADPNDRQQVYDEGKQYLTSLGIDMSQAPQEPDESNMKAVMEAGGLSLDETYTTEQTPTGRHYQVSSAGGPDVASPRNEPASGTTVNVGGVKDDQKYWDQRLQDQAKMMTDIKKRAEASYNEMLALDRFIASSKGTTAGGAQPIISGVKNFLSSFGAKFSDLKDIAQMEQAVGDIKVNFFKEFGARGLTDKDMEIIRDSLPRLNTSEEARENVVRILKKTHAKSIEGYEKAIAEEKKVYPERSQKVFTPDWYNEYVKYSQAGDLSPEEQAELDARESIMGDMENAPKVPRNELR